MHLARRLFNKSVVERQLDAELSFHMEQHIADYVTQGLTPIEARRRAQLALGGVEQVKEKCRAQRGIPLLGSFMRDFGFAIRQLKKSPWFTVTAILTLALGIGANLAIFDLLYTLMWRSLPVPHPSQLVRVVVSAPEMGDSGAGVSWLMLDEINHRQHSLNGLSGWTLDAVTMPQGDGSLNSLYVEFVSGNGFEQLGLKPLLGRLLIPADDVVGGPSTGWPVVLSYNMWKGEFNSDRNVIGRKVTISGTPVIVVGVLPGYFHGLDPGQDPKLYLPLQSISVLSTSMFGSDNTEWKKTFRMYALGRLKPGVSFAQANAEIASLRTSVFEATLPPQALHNPRVERFGLKILSGRTADFQPGMLAIEHPVQSFLLMECLVGIVFILCCVNIGGLMLSRNYARRHEFCVRAALGASRWRLAQQCLIEGSILASAGATLGIVFAWAINGIMLDFLTPVWMTSRLVSDPDVALILAGAALAFLATLLFGAVPAFFAGRTLPAGVLNVRASSGARRQWIAHAFVPLQFALSLILVLVAGFFCRSLAKEFTEPVGFNLEHLITTSISGKPDTWPGAQPFDTVQRMIETMDTLPGIRSASIAFEPPLYNYDTHAHFAADSGSPAPDDSNMLYNYVSADYFKTMQIQVLEGREFLWSERDSSVCILNQLAADYFFPHQKALGLYVRAFDSKDPQMGWHMDAAVCRVIGIVANAKYATLKMPAPRTLYFPMTPRLTADGVGFIIRFDNEAVAINSYRKVIAEYVPKKPIYGFITVRDAMERVLGTDRMMAMLSLSFGILALLLSVIGLYGLLSTNVTQRTGEIGIRIALGARRETVLKMILSDAIRMVIVGVALGSVGAFFAVRTIKAMLYSISPFDPWVLLGSALLLAGVALLAAFIPARRAARVDPMTAIRYE